MSRAFGVGIIGAGLIASDHAEACHRLGDRLRLVAAADIDVQRLRRLSTGHFVPMLYEDYRKLLEREDIDVVSICTPPALHEEMVVAGLEAGKYVICEKPLAHTLASADRIVEAARKYPGRVSVVYQLRYVPDVRKLVWLRDEGRLGALRFGHFARFDRAVASAASSWWGKWAVAGGGVAMTQFVHQLDLMYHIFGVPAQVYAWMDTTVAPIESEDTFAAIIRFQNGASVTCAATLAAQEPSLTWDIFGTRGTVHNPWAYRCSNGEAESEEAAELERRFPALSKPARKLNRSIPARAWRKLLRTLHLGGTVSVGRPACLHVPYYRAVLEALEARRDVPVPPEEALVSLELCTAIYVSALTGSPVGWPVERASPYCNGISADEYRARQERYV